MNKKSHVLIARIVCGHLQQQYGICLHDKSFVFGNVLPDLLPSFLYRPHFWRCSRAYVQRMICSLLQKSKSASDGSQFSLFLGILCHLYADFFCHVHTARFHGGLRLHILYEKQLYCFLMEHLPEITAVCFIVRPETGLDAAGILEHFKKLQASYYGSPPSSDNDVVYSILACVEAIVLIMSSLQADPIPEHSLACQQPIL